MEAGVKAFMVAIFAGGSMIAAFYMAYAILLLCVLGMVGFIAYLFFNRDNMFPKPDIHD